MGRGRWNFLTTKHVRAGGDETTHGTVWEKMRCTQCTQHVVVEHHRPWMGQGAWPPVVCGPESRLCPATKHPLQFSVDRAKDDHPSRATEGVDSIVHVYVSRTGSSHDFHHVVGEAALHNAICDGARVVLRRELVAQVHPGRVPDVTTVTATTHHTEQAEAGVPTFLHADVRALVTGHFNAQRHDLRVHGAVSLARAAFSGMQGRVELTGVHTLHADVFEMNSIESLACDDHTEVVQRGAFDGSHRLRAVRFGASLHLIGATSFRMTRLTVVDLSHTRVVVIEQGAFQQCTALTSVTLPGTVEHVGARCFDTCLALTRVGAQHSPSLAVLEVGLFRHARSLREHAFGPHVRVIQACAFQHSGIVRVDLSACSVRSIESAAFDGCEHLQHVRCPPTLFVLGVAAFRGCSRLEVVDMAGCIGLGTLPSRCFDGCLGLVSVLMPPRLRSIRQHCFARCTRLATVVLPGSVNSIGKLAFSGTSRLRSIMINGVVLPEMCATALQHSGAIVVTKRGPTVQQSPAVVAVPPVQAERSGRFGELLIAMRLSNADIFRADLTKHVKGHRLVSNLDVVRDRRHRRAHGQTPVLPMEIWLHILKHNRVWVGDRQCTQYFPRILCKPSVNVWEQRLNNGFGRCAVATPPLLVYLLKECSRRDVLLLALKTHTNQDGVLKSTPLAVHLYVRAAGPLPDSMITHNVGLQKTAVEVFRSIVSGADVRDDDPGWVDRMCVDTL